MIRHGLPWGYPLIMAGSLAAGVFLARRSQSGLKLTGLEKTALGLGAFCGAMIGAKFVFLLVDPRASRKFADLFDGGMTFLV